MGIKKQKASENTVKNCKVCTSYTLYAKDIKTIFWSLVANEYRYIIHRFDKKIGHCVLVVNRDVRKWIVLFEHCIYRSKHTSSCSSNPTYLIIGG